MDFYQSRHITTYPVLKNERPGIRKGLCDYKGGISLVIPAIPREFESDSALETIREGLRDIPYVNELVVVLNKDSDKECFDHARGFFSDIGMNYKILWADGPNVNEALKEVDENKTIYFGDREKLVACRGKGMAVHIGDLYSSLGSDVLVHFDADIETFEPGIVDNLAFPVALDGKELNVAYFARFNDKLYGRATRLLAFPFLNALQDLKCVKGDENAMNDIEYLKSFRYVWSGDNAKSRRLATEETKASDFGLETHERLEARERCSPTVEKISQVDILPNSSYTHKHQEFGKTPDEGILKLGKEAVKPIFRRLIRKYGIDVMSYLSPLKQHYRELALAAINQYRSVAGFNDLSFDKKAETSMVNSFLPTIEAAGREIMDNPTNKPILSSWQEIRRVADPEIDAKLYKAVEMDNQRRTQVRV